MIREFIDLLFYAKAHIRQCKNNVHRNCQNNVALTNQWISLETEIFFHTYTFTLYEQAYLLRKQWLLLTILYGYKIIIPCTFQTKRLWLHKIDDHTFQEHINITKVEFYFYCTAFAAYTSILHMQMKVFEAMCFHTCSVLLYPL